MSASKPGSQEIRVARKTMARVDKQLRGVTAREAELNAEAALASQDYERLAAIGAALAELAAEREQLELEWLEAAELLE